MAEQIEVGDLTARHIGARVLVHDGNTVIDGTLGEFWVGRSFKGEVKFTLLRVLTASGKFDLKDAPTDYVIQLADEPEPAETDA